MGISNPWNRRGNEDKVSVSTSDDGRPHVTLCDVFGTDADPRVRSNFPRGLELAVRLCQRFHWRRRHEGSHGQAPDAVLRAVGCESALRFNFSRISEDPNMLPQSEVQTRIELFSMRSASGVTSAANECL